MTYKAVLFDLDGTLLDTLEDIADSANVALRSMRLPEHSVDTYKDFIGDGVEDLASRALPPHLRDDDHIEELVKGFRQAYGQGWALKTRPYHGIPELLDALVQQQIQIAVLSNKPHDFTCLVVERLLPEWAFSAVVGAQPAVPKKPDPTGAIHVAQLLDVSPADFVYLGDGYQDMLAATTAGMFPVGALWGFQPATRLLESGARVLISSPMELLQVLKTAGHKP